MTEPNAASRTVDLEPTTEAATAMQQVAKRRVEYALEADPGRCTASFPTFDCIDAARAAADVPAFVREGLPAPRVLVRSEYEGNWKVCDGD